jgi:hypothetical protein
MRWLGMPPWSQVRDIAGADAPALRQALKQLAHDKVPAGHPGDNAASPAASGDGFTETHGNGGLPNGGSNSGSGTDDSPDSAHAGSSTQPDAAMTDGKMSLSAGGNGDSALMCQSCTSSSSDKHAGGGSSSSAAGGGGSAAATSGSASASLAALPGPALARSDSGGGGSSSGSGPQQRQQQQRLEVAAAAVLVHAASCSDAACPVPHCNKMKKIHAHFLECTTTDCAICKKLRPLTYIHAKHCHTAPGEQCVIPYCSRAKRELQALMSRNQNAQRAALAAGAASSGAIGGGDSGSGVSMAGGMLHSSSGASMIGSGSASWNGSHGALGGLDSSSVQTQAHYLLVLAHVMKCVNVNCSVAECATTKALVTNHTRSCRAGDACAYPRCALSKRLMRHHRECPDQNCMVCLPLRRRLQAAKMNVQASQPPGGDGSAAAPKRSKTKRRKDDSSQDPTDENGEPSAYSGAGSGPPSKRKRKDSGGGSKKGKHASDAASEAENQKQQQLVQEVDMLEAGFAVTVHHPSHRRSSSENSGEWRPGTVLRAYTSPITLEPVYDIMMHSGVEEKGIAHERCRMVCNVCLTDKRAFKPPPMFCEKCVQAIHTRWSYWEESGDEGGVKLCKRCFTDLKASPMADSVLSDLAHRLVRIDNFQEKKEKDRPEYVDNWVQCDECHSWQHWTCAMYKGEDTPEDCLFFCCNCRKGRNKHLPKELCVAPSEDLPETVLSKKLQQGLHEELEGMGVTHAPVSIRVVSNVDCIAKIAPPPPMPGSAAAHQAAKNKGKLQLQNGKVGTVEFPYRSKCILAFQRTGTGATMGEGPEICFFAMYVQEYGSDCPEPNTNRVYISYLDSVRYFTSSPEGHRTTVYHSILINYLDYARELGFEHGHIWVSPPKQGDDYIFYAHPEIMLQKRMGLLKLKEWYEKMLIVARERKVILDFQDMLDAYKDIESASDIPVFSGDHWAASIALKIQELKNKEKELAKKKGNGKGVKGGGVHAEIKQEEALLNQIQEEMRSMRNHFIVVRLCEQRIKGQRNTIVDPVPIISNEFVDQRSSFLEKCQMYHWQFDEVRATQAEAQSPPRSIQLDSSRSRPLSDTAGSQRVALDAHAALLPARNAQDRRRRTARQRRRRPRGARRLVCCWQQRAAPQPLVQDRVGDAGLDTAPQPCQRGGRFGEVGSASRGALPPHPRADQQVEARHPAGKVQPVLGPVDHARHPLRLHPRAQAHRRVIHVVPAEHAG